MVGAFAIMIKSWRYIILTKFVQDISDIMAVVGNFFQNFLWPKFFIIRQKTLRWPPMQQCEVVCPLEAMAV